MAPSVVVAVPEPGAGLTLETFDAIAGALGLRLVETARGRPKPARATRATRAARAARLPADPGEPAGIRPGSEDDRPAGRDEDEIEGPSGR